jgi:hypothetical protein
LIDIRPSTSADTRARAHVRSRNTFPPRDGATRQRDATDAARDDARDDAIDRSARSNA